MSGPGAAGREWLGFQGSPGVVETGRARQTNSFVENSIEAGILLGCLPLFLLGRLTLGRAMSSEQYRGEPPPDPRWQQKISRGRNGRWMGRRDRLVGRDH
jgi:hypothetical protein